MGGSEREHAVQRMKDCIEEHITEPITLRMKGSHEPSHGSSG